MATPPGPTGGGGGVPGRGGIGKSLQGSLIGMAISSWLISDPAPPVYKVDYSFELDLNNFDESIEGRPAFIHFGMAS